MVSNILADHMIDLAIFKIPLSFKVLAVLITPLFKRSHVADRRIEPNVVVFSWVSRDFKAKVRLVPGDTPALQVLVKPLDHLVGNRRVGMSREPIL